MRTRTKAVVAIGLTTVVAAGAVYAAGTAGHFGLNRIERLLSVDQDRDKRVSAQEFEAAEAKRFVARDLNKDGILTAEELAAFSQRFGRRKGWSDRLFERSDADKDGKLSKQEFEQDQKAMFARLDKNGDGKLTSDESPRWFNRRAANRGADTQTLEDVLARAERRFAAMDTNSDGTVLKNEIDAAAAERQAHRVKREMHRFDANRDGKITQDEYMMSAKRRFSALDLDDDGRISADDMSPSVRSEWNKAK
jgi:Ca2+-binding EF-hand superfamily protein